MAPLAAFSFSASFSLAHQPCHLGANHLSLSLAGRLKISGRLEVYVLKNGLPTEVAAGVRPDDERVGLDLPCAIAAEVVLHVGLVVVVVVRGGEVAAGASDQVIDPCEVVHLDEVEVQTEAVNVEVAGMPANGLG